MDISSLRHSVFQETGIGFGPGVGVYMADSRSTTSVTIPSLIDSNWVGSETGQLWIFRPTVSSGRDRPAGPINTSTGEITNAGQAWSGSGGSEQVELIRFLSHSEFLSILDTVFQRLDQTVLHPLGTFEDSDCEASNTSAWNDSNVTLAKVTDAEHVETGRRALKLTMDTAAGFAASDHILVNPGRYAWASATVKSASGDTAKFTLWDVTHGKEIDSVTYQGLRYARVSLKEKIPAGCHEVEVRLAGSGNGEVVYADHFGGVFVQDGDLNLRAPSWLDEAWRFRKLREARYGSDLGSQVYDARSRTFQDYARHEDVYFNVIPSDVHPYVLQLDKSPPMKDLWVEGARRSLDMLSGSLSDAPATESVETDLPDRLIILTASLAVCDYILGRQPSNTEIQASGGRIAQELAAWHRAQEPELPLQRTEFFRSGLGRRV